MLSYPQVKSISNHLKNVWKHSYLFFWIDNQISKYFQKRLQNDQFTILCSNCIGGIIYHRLGKRFLSPTVNMFFSQPDFVEFCVNMDHYLKQDLQFQVEETPYPIAQLLGNGETIRDITLHFNHDHDVQAARIKWEERKKRIRRDNLYIIIYYLDGITTEDLKRLESVSCRNKVVLTKEPLSDIPWSVYIKPNKRQQYSLSYLGKNAFGVRYYETKFDFVSFLNHK